MPAVNSFFQTSKENISTCKIFSLKNYLNLQRSEATAAGSLCTAGVFNSKKNNFKCYETLSCLDPKENPIIVEAVHVIHTVVT